MRIHLVGAGGFAREVLDIIEARQSAGAELEVAGIFADGHADSEELEARGYRHAGPLADLGAAGPDDKLVIAFNDPQRRDEVRLELESAGWSAATLIHPDTTIGSKVSCGSGVIVCAGARIGTNVTLGDHVQLNANCTIGHDARVGAAASINPLASIGGRCTIGPRALIGTGANVLQSLKVGSDAVVGAGAVVLADVSESTTVVGAPARPVQARNG